MQLLLGAASAVALVVCALIVSARVTGPLVRICLGDPVDFNQDYTSPEARRQALFAQSVSLLLAFVAFGSFTDGWRTLKPGRWSVLAANPFTLAAGYWLYRMLIGLEGPAEYTDYFSWFYLSILGPLVFAPAVLLGLRVRGRLRLRR